LDQKRFSSATEWDGHRSAPRRVAKLLASPYLQRQVGAFDGDTRGHGSVPVRKNTVTSHLVFSSNSLRPEPPDSVSRVVDALLSAHALHMRFVLAQLDLGLTCCLVARSNPFHRLSPRVVRTVWRALALAAQFLLSARVSRPDFQRVQERIKDLHRALRWLPRPPLPLEISAPRAGLSYGRILGRGEHAIPTVLSI
jgi:hypothetical protein